MTDVDLAFIAKQLERVLAEQAGMRDEMLVLGARMDRIDATLDVVLLEVRGLTRAMGRLHDRLVKVEEVVR